MKLDINVPKIKLLHLHINSSPKDTSKIQI